jgi:hypothetical protein
MTRRHPYDPWTDVALNWPQVRVIFEDLTDDLLGEVRAMPDLEISIRADSSAAQQRCTLAHELVHLERGLDDCGPWQDREERQVHSEVARRLIPLPQLVEALRNVGCSDDIAALAAILDVDSETAQLRIATLDPAQRRWIRRQLRPGRELWSVA